MLRYGWRVWVCVALLGAVAYGETAIEAPVKSVGLFKNGLCVVTRQAEVPGDGAYVLLDVPEPLHGTWWVESTAMVETRVTQREVMEPANGLGAGNYAKALAGHTVEVWLKRMDGGGRPMQIEGTVAEDAGDRQPTYSRDYSTNRYGWSRGGDDLQPGAVGGGDSLRIVDAKGQSTFVSPAMIGMLKVTDVKPDWKPQVPVKKAAMIFKVSGMKEGKAALRISYLTRGLSWAPSYRVNLKDQKQLQLTQQADVRDELADFDGAEVFLISGFPNVRFGHVLSLLSPDQTLSAFFQQLSQQTGASQASMMTQQAVMVNAASPSMGAPAMDFEGPGGDAEDIHYQSIGKRSMKKGEALSLITATGEADYRRIVEWIVPDNRAANGRLIGEDQRQQNPEKYDDAPWDVVTFCNPLKMPMTTGAALVTEEGRFLGQGISYFTNPEERAALRITKALSVVTRALEHEEAGQRKTVSVGGDEYRQTRVKGELTMSNRRKRDVDLVVRCRFSGELVSAEGHPESELLEEGVYSVNKRNELVWKLTLKAGQKQTLSYEYEVLVD